LLVIIDGEAGTVEEEALLLINIFLINIVMVARGKKMRLRLE